MDKSDWIKLELLTEYPCDIMPNEPVRRSSGLVIMKWKAKSEIFIEH